jgi:hypothetical protein
VPTTCGAAKRRRSLDATCLKSFDSQSDSQTDGRGRNRRAWADAEIAIFLKKATGRYWADTPPSFS